MPQYLLNIIQPTGQVPPPEVLEPVMRDVARLNEEMRAAGVWVFAAGLHQPDATTVVRPDGLVTDGPYAEGSEFIGGFDVIEAADLDEALVWTHKLTGVLGLPVELRPVATTF